jgi:uncharacterized protein YcfL
MKLVLILLLFLAGCSTTVPVARNFPTAPELLQEPCKNLKQLTGDHISIIDYTKTVTDNYTLYHECSAKNSAWIYWYQKQKQVFESE